MPCFRPLLLVAVSLSTAGMLACPVAPPDAGPAFDAGTAATDAGVVVDGGGPPTDAGGIVDGGSPPSDAGPRCSPAEITSLEVQMDSILGAVATDTDFSYAVEVPGRASYLFERGASTIDTVYESASTSKWVVGAVILRLVDQNITRNGETFSLQSRPQDWIPGWPIAPTDPLYDITLAQLLSFTSGLTEVPGCVDTGLFFDFDGCVNRIGVVNSDSGRTPGAAFYYSSSHLQVAGRMAIGALGVASWTAVFDDFKTATALFPTAVFDLPSSTNPRLAGGMHWTGAEYLAFVRRMAVGDLLSAEMQAAMFRDQIAGLNIVQTPATLIGEDWHYGFAGWIECAEATFNCATVTRVSSPGAYGAYPFVDVEFGYFGILARQGGLGSFPEGIPVARSIAPQLEQWSACFQ